MRTRYFTAELLYAEIIAKATAIEGSLIIVIIINFIDIAQVSIAVRVDCC